MNGKACKKAIFDLVDALYGPDNWPDTQRDNEVRVYRRRSFFSVTYTFPSLFDFFSLFSLNIYQIFGKYLPYFWSMFTLYLETTSSQAAD